MATRSINSREVLYNSKFLRVVRLDGWFDATEPARSKGNMAVAVLPYMKTADGVKFLARYELNPAHLTNKYHHQTSIITGACETGDPLYHAKMELLEEGGYDIPEKRFRHMGIVNPIKASRTKLHLFAVQIFKKDKQNLPEGDGGEHESREYADWVRRDVMVWAKDPYIQTIMMRAGL